MWVFISSLASFALTWQGLNGGGFHRRQLQMIAQWRIVFLNEYPHECSSAMLTRLAPCSGSFALFRILRRGGSSSLHLLPIIV